MCVCKSPQTVLKLSFMFRAGVGPEIHLHLSKLLGDAHATGPQTKPGVAKTLVLGTGRSHEGKEEGRRQKGLCVDTKAFWLSPWRYRELRAAQLREKIGWDFWNFIIHCGGGGKRQQSRLETTLCTTGNSQWLMPEEGGITGGTSHGHTGTVQYREVY